MSIQLKQPKMLLPALLLAAWTGLCAFAPWQQVHPSDASLVRSLSRAALWTHAYDSLPGAKIDLVELLIEATLLFFACFFVISLQSRSKIDSSH